jgi:hypothetical protein
MKSHLSTRDIEVLQHVARYRIGTLVSLHRALFSAVHRHAVGKVTRRLVERGWLLKHPLGPRRCYYTLSAKAARRLGCSADSEPKSPSPRELIHDFGMLKYCCLAERERKRLTREELASDLPALPSANGHAAGYFLDAGYRPAVCGVLWVDHGGDPSELVAANRKKWDSLVAQASFRHFIKQSGIRLVVLTASAERAAVIEDLLQRYRWPEKVTLAVEVLPQLLPLYLQLEDFRQCAAARRSRCQANGDRHAARRGWSISARQEVREPQIMPRDYEIFQHLRRFRIATPTSIHNWLFPGRCPHATRLVTSRLVRNGWLRRHLLGPQRCFFTFSARAAQLLGETHYAVGTPLLRQEFVHDYGLLKYCSLAQQHRQRLTPEELERDYPALCCPALDSERYFVDNGRRPAEAGMVWHAAHNAKDAVSRCWADWNARWAHAEFRKFVTRRGFRIVFVVATADEVAALRNEVKRYRWPAAVRVVTVVLPELSYVSDGN